MLVGLDQHVSREQATPAIQELSYFRDELPNILQDPLVIVASPETIAHLISVAQASVREFTLEAHGLAPNARLTPSPALATTGNGRAPAGELEKPYPSDTRTNTACIDIYRSAVESIARGRSVAGTRLS